MKTDYQSRTQAVQVWMAFLNSMSIYENNHSQIPIIKQNQNSFGINTYMFINTLEWPFSECLYILLICLIWSINHDIINLM